NAGLAKPIPVIWFIRHPGRSITPGFAMLRCEQTATTSCPDNALFFGPRLFRELDQHFTQRAGVGDPRRKIEPQDPASSLQIDSARIAGAATPVVGRGTKKLGG